ncbi:DinB family protein [Parapedobacter deserti]|uniref:DinB family protein n=1 Tax=Parapedobacter deserti TaxID=1912957 RepID=A0ABV7JGC5_9SPHI
MKRLLFLLFAVSAATGTVTAQNQAVGAGQRDKAFLLDYYQQTLTDLQRAVDGLNGAQLRFQPAPDKWSISQCLEHIIATEQALLGYAKKTISQAPNPERRSEINVSDDDVIKGMTDRSFKAQAPGELAPKEAGKYTNADAAIKDLRKQRKELIGYIDGLSSDDLRNRIADSPFGPVDGFHSLLYIPAHTARHTLQIEEIKADRKFPAK